MAETVSAAALQHPKAAVAPVAAPVPALPPPAPIPAPSPTQRSPSAALSSIHSDIVPEDAPAVPVDGQGVAVLAPPPGSAPIEGAGALAPQAETRSMSWGAITGMNIAIDYTAVTVRRSPPVHLLCTGGTMSRLWATL